MDYTIIDSLKIVSDKQDLSFEQALQAMNYIMDGKATDAQIAGFLIALKMKTETAEEIAAFAKAMRLHADKVIGGEKALDIVGTGGDMADTFNVSTTSAIVISACGIPVAKHGSHSSSGKCGAADVLKQLGVKLGTSPETDKKMLDEIGICFMYAPRHHSSMKYVTPARKQLGVPTLFNILGPLANPAGVGVQMIGAYSRSLAYKMAKVLKILGTSRSRVITGDDGLDEVSLTTSTTIFDIVNGDIVESRFDPAEYGFKYCSIDKLKGGDAEYNAKIALEVLNGVRNEKRDMILINSALAINTYSSEYSIKDAIKMAEDAIDSGKAKNQLEKMIEMSNSEKEE